VDGMRAPVGETTNAHVRNVGQTILDQARRTTMVWVCLVDWFISESPSLLIYAFLRKSQLRFMFVFGSLDLMNQAGLRWCLVARV
jgi:hypothetical protein